MLSPIFLFLFSFMNQGRKFNLRGGLSHFSLKETLILRMASIARSCICIINKTVPLSPTIWTILHGIKIWAYSGSLHYIEPSALVIYNCIIMRLSVLICRCTFNCNIYLPAFIFLWLKTTASLELILQKVLGCTTRLSEGCILSRFHHIWGSCSMPYS